MGAKGIAMGVATVKIHRYTLTVMVSVWFVHHCFLFSYLCAGLFRGVVDLGRSVRLVDRSFSPSVRPFGRLFGRSVMLHAAFDRYLFLVVGCFVVVVVLVTSGASRWQQTALLTLLIRPSELDVDEGEEAEGNKQKPKRRQARTEPIIVVFCPL